MYESQEPYFEEEGIYESIHKFENTLHGNKNCYFDVIEFETIVDYYLDQLNFHIAQIAVERGIAQHPYAPSLKFKWAQILINSGKPARGLRILREIEHLETSNSEFYLVLGSAFNLLGKKEEAQRAFNLAIQNAEDSKDEVVYNIAYAYINTRRYKLAIRYLKLAIEINPNNTTAIHELALVYERLDDFEKCVEYYNKFLSIDPFSDNIWLNLGIIYTNLDKVDLAVEAFDFAIALSPDYMSAYFSKANTLVNADRFNEAVAVYNEIVRFDPSNVQAFTYLGECYEKLELYKRAILFYQKALAVNADYSDAWFGIGMANYQMEHYTDSLGCFAKANKIDPENPEYWYMLGEVYKKLNEHTKSAEAYNRTVELDPNDYEAWICRAELSFSSENINDAIKILNKAYQYNHDIASINYQLATYYLHDNQPKIAYRYFEKGLSINFTEHSEHLNRIPEKLNKETINQLINKYKNKSQQNS